MLPLNRIPSLPLYSHTAPLHTLPHFFRRPDALLGATAVRKHTATPKVINNPVSEGLTFAMFFKSYA